MKILFFGFQRANSEGVAALMRKLSVPAPFKVQIQSKI